MHLALDTGRRERKRQQTADLLAGTAFELFEQHGYDAVTMERIAAAADVAKGTLYNHFPVKEALLAHHFHQRLRNGQPALWAALQAEPDPVARFRRFFRLAADWAEQHRRYLAPYLQYRLGQPLLDRPVQSRSGTDAIFARLVADALAAGRLRAGADPAQLVHYLQHLYLGALTRWLVLPDIDLAAELDAMLDLFLHGAAPTEGA